ncbi:MAG: FtsX-like permease family protein [Bacteroidetes bacterium]|nr:FtsX-like permease family protein [Bacteroidota bacterium]MDA1019450.1 FtsX-like permease family protein [Bacteroidota bacterium]
MRFESVMASRFIRSNPYKNTISSPIIKISILSIVMGLVMMLISISSGVGLQKTIQNKMSSFFGHISISNFQNNSSQSSLKPVSIDQDFYTNNTNQEIIHIQGVAYKSGLVITDSTFEGVIFKGIGSDFNFDKFSPYLIKGDMPSFDKDISNEVIISQYLSERLSIDLNKKFKATFFKNDSFSIPNERIFKVVGIYNSGLIEFDKLYFLGDIKHIQRMNKWDETQIGSFEVFIEKFNKIDEVSDELYTNSPSELDVQTISEKFIDIFNWIALFDMNVLVIIVIMILVGGINMITALLVTILEKTHIIGVLKVLGATNRSLRSIFLANGIYLISVGLIIGNVIGIGLIFLQKYTGFLKLDPQTYYVSEIPLDFNIFSIFILNFSVLFFCLLMLIIPSFIITRISPTDSLKIK